MSFVWLVYLVPIMFLVAIAFSVRAVVQCVALPLGRKWTGQCARCRYDISANASLQCPECGSDLRGVGIRSRASEYRSRAKLIPAIGGWGLLVLVVGFLVAGVWIVPGLIGRGRYYSIGSQRGVFEGLEMWYAEDARRTVMLRPSWLARPPVLELDLETKQCTLSTGPELHVSSRKYDGKATVSELFRMSGIDLDQVDLTAECEDLDKLFQRIAESDEGPVFAGRKTLWERTITGYFEPPRSRLRYPWYIGPGEIAWVTGFLVFGAGSMLIVRRRRSLLRRLQMCG